MTKISVRASHSGTGLTPFVCLYLIPCYCVFLLNTSSYSCFVAVCHLLFFPLGIACLVFSFLLLYCIASLLYLWMCRRNGTNVGQPMPKKWVIHCIHSIVSFFSFFFPSLTFLPCPSKRQAVWWCDMLCGKGSQVGISFFLMPSTYPFLKNLALDTFGTHHCIPYVFPISSPLRQRYIFKFS